MYKKHGATNTNGKIFAAIDKDFRSALIQAESVKSPKYFAPWSKQLHAAVACCQFWKMIYASARFKIDFTDKLKLISDKWDIDMPSPLITIEEAKIGLRKLKMLLNGQNQRTSTPSSNVR